MSSFREEAAKIQAAYDEVQQNQQELDEGLGSLLRAGGKLLKGVGKKAVKTATSAPVKSAVKSTAKKAAKPAAVVGGAAAVVVVVIGGGGWCCSDDYATSAAAYLHREICS